MLRATVFCMVAVAALAVPVAATSSPATGPECARVTVADAENAEADAEVYVEHPFAEGVPTNGDDLLALKEKALEFVQGQAGQPGPAHPTGTSILQVQVDVVVPSSDEPALAGQRVSVWVDVSACVGQ